MKMFLNFQQSGLQKVEKKQSVFFTLWLGYFIAHPRQTPGQVPPESGSNLQTRVNLYDQADNDKMCLVYPHKYSD